MPSPSEKFFVDMIKKGLQEMENNLSPEEENLLYLPVLELPNNPRFTSSMAANLQTKCTQALSKMYTLGTSGDKRSRSEMALLWADLNKSLYKTSQLVISGVVQNWYSSEGRRLERKAVSPFRR